MSETIKIMLTAIMKKQLTRKEIFKNIRGEFF
jgi:hypothetical protein